MPSDFEPFTVIDDDFDFDFNYAPSIIDVDASGGWKNSGWDKFDRRLLAGPVHLADKYRFDTLDDITVMVPLH